MRTTHWAERYLQPEDINRLKNGQPIREKTLRNRYLPDGKHGIDYTYAGGSRSRVRFHIREDLTFERIDFVTERRYDRFVYRILGFHSVMEFFDTNALLDVQSCCGWDCPFMHGGEIRREDAISYAVQFLNNQGYATEVIGDNSIIRIEIPEKPKNET